MDNVLNWINEIVWGLPTLLLIFLARGAGEISTIFGLNQSFGDILTGILGALLAQQRTLNAETLTLMQLAAYLHASAAIRAPEALGEYCVTPEDVVRSIRLA